MNENRTEVIVGCIPNLFKLYSSLNDDNAAFGLAGRTAGRTAGDPMDGVLDSDVVRITIKFPSARLTSNVR
jgi:hypothetical protein